MKKGRISNIPAPYLYIDGRALFFESKFGYSPNLKYTNKLAKLMRYVNISIFIEDKKIFKKINLEKSPFLYTEILKQDLKSFIKFLQKNKLHVFTSENRVSLFLGRSYLLDISVENILAKVGA
jgi:hypothetical protein